MGLMLASFGKVLPILTVIWENQLSPYVQFKGWIIAGIVLSAQYQALSGTIIFLMGKLV
jgi:hypothetical protein